jgi:hypothetical protein
MTAGDDFCQPALEKRRRRIFVPIYGRSKLRAPCSTITRDTTHLGPDPTVEAPQLYRCPQALPLPAAFSRDGDLCVWAFDLLHHNGRDLRELPLCERKARLEKVIITANAGWLHYS